MGRPLSSNNRRLPSDGTPPMLPTLSSLPEVVLWSCTECWSGCLTMRVALASSGTACGGELGDTTRGLALPAWSSCSLPHVGRWASSL